jgi:protein-S-isoprenylcysteine O-methyltransferase Ste14
MDTYNWLIAIFWLCFVAYWIISALNAKKVIKRTNRTGWILGRLIIFVLVVAMFQIPALRRPLFPGTTAVLLLGTILCGSGITLAIWARWHLGRNWNFAPSIQENHELVTSGPYRYVRHPIYTGMMIAFLGSALVGGPGWLIAFAAASLMFVARIHTEEQFMMEIFPGQYPEYKKRTKALLPFVW